MVVGGEDKQVVNGQPSVIRHISLTFFVEMDVFYIDNIL